MIEKRIQRLETALQDILRIASVEGETFTAEVVARVQQVQEGGLVQQLSRELEKRHRLVTAHILAWLGQQRLSLYRFRHQLFQQYVYHSLTEIERAYLHEAVGSVLEAIYSEQTEHIAVQLARHFEQAGLTEKAVTYLLEAGKRAARLSAYQEALAHMTKGLALLERLRDTTERAQKELELQIALGTALMATKGNGAAEVEHTYNDLAQRQHDPAIVVAHRLMGCRFYLGELVSARPHFEQIAALYNVEQHRPLISQYALDPGSAGLSAESLADGLKIAEGDGGLLSYRILSYRNRLARFTFPALWAS